MTAFVFFLLVASVMMFLHHGCMKGQIPGVSTIKGHLKNILFIHSMLFLELAAFCGAGYVYFTYGESLSAFQATLAVIAYLILHNYVCYLLSSWIDTTIQDIYWRSRHWGAI